MLTDADISQLAEIGITEVEARRQLDLLQHPPAASHLDRPATPGDGILTIEPEELGELLALADECAEAGRFSKFVPASGAASRMFDAPRRIAQAGVESREDLRARAESGDAAAGEVVRLLDETDDLPFPASFSKAADNRTLSVTAVLEGLLDPPGLGYAALSKGLIPFHRYDEAARTAFEEHLVEGSRFLADHEGRCRFHFTVSKEHQREFEARAGAFPASGLDVRFSNQSPATDTLALDIGHGPARTPEGRLLLRPGGHGALLGNLEESGGDLVLIKNIDNIIPEPRQRQAVEWQRALLGLLARVQRRAFECLEALHQSDDVGALAEAESFAQDVFRWQPDAGSPRERRQAVHDLLARPLRVCGMVRNEGEPGGGPFWVNAPDGSCSLQIVESAQVDHADAVQEEIWNCSTHFNPVLLAVALRDADGKPFRLEEFVDSQTAFVTEKPLSGRQVRVLERPGLWNGAMGYWNTLFVEVPMVTFAPVKTVLDLLRPEHQPTPGC
jgi:hypothetical protein